MVCLTCTTSFVGCLPLRYTSALKDGQRRKIEWMTSYVNDSIAEQSLPAEWKVVLPKDAAHAAGR
jgi:hypothetical protein